MNYSLLKPMFGSTVLALGILSLAPAGVSAAKPADQPQPFTAEWAQVKSGLMSSSLAHTVTVADGTRLFTFTLPSGSTIVLAEPVGPTNKVAPTISVGGCGWFSVCVYLNRTDQGALAAGGAFLLGMAICAIPAVGWISCAAVGTALTIAAFYIAAYGFCSGSQQLQVGIFPNPGGNVRCVYR